MYSEYDEKAPAMFPCFADQYSKKPVTDVFTNDTDMDKRGMTRTVPMKVLLLAVGRTGTACTFYLYYSPHNSILPPKNHKAKLTAFFPLPQPCAPPCATSATSRPTT